MKLLYLKYASWLFLAVPFLIFVIGWLKPIIALPVFILLALVLWNVLRQFVEDGKIETKDVIFALCLILPILFFSGITGYTFQNWDFHGRNAVFHDLINYTWPVVYQKNALTGNTLIMSYYMAYWLPSALIGKLFGWETANIMLYIWTVLGVFFIVALLATRMQISMLKTSFLLFSFSGMDIIGVGVNRILDRSLYPGLWPPVQHLEWWSLPVEISSILTQIYWVFNQAIPVLLAMSLWLNGVQRKHLIFLWGLTFFFSPLPSIGLMIFFAVDILLKDAPHQGVSSYLRQIYKTISVINFSGSFIILIGFAYFATNLAAQEKSLQSWDLLLHLIFFLLEGGILWLALLRKKYRDSFWTVTGLTLFFVVFIRIGNNQDFVMRATIPSLLYLMVGVGEEVFRSRGWTRNFIVLCLVAGSITPLYEINRSVVRTLNYYLNTNIPIESSQIKSNPNYIALVPEVDHPNSIVADSFKTLNTNDKSFDWRNNFLGSYGDNFFTTWLMK